MSDDQSPVLLTCEGGVACLTFNRPRALNAVDRATAAAFLTSCREIAARDDVRVVVMRGNGPAFMAGGDIQGFNLSAAEAPGYFESLIDPVHEAVELLASLAQPVVASLHGAVAGAGFGFAMIADLAIAADDTKFTSAYCKLGVSADGSFSWMLPRLVGVRRAMEFGLLSDIFDAEEALRLGLVNKVVAAEKLKEETEALAGRLAMGPTVAFGRMKALMRQSLQRTLAEQLKAEKEALLQCVITDDFAEGVHAFLNKRKPTFKGR
jgi:2-(1,2-epoxy-1,2-dihydrophenyl)acetyl-CoA isomerase